MFESSLLAMRQDHLARLRPPRGRGDGRRCACPAVRMPTQTAQVPAGPAQVTVSSTYRSADGVTKWTTAASRAARALGSFVLRPHRTPATGIGVILITGMWLALRLLPEAAARRVLLSMSTNLHHLQHDPISVLAGSVVTLADPMDIGELLLFVLILAPLERLAGVRKMAALFFAGHVLATCTSEFGQRLLHYLGIVRHVAWNRIDVGPSYGEMAALAGLCFLLPTGWWRRILTVVAVSPVVVTWLVFRNLATTGHMIALGLGAAMAPWLLGAVRRRLHHVVPTRSLNATSALQTCSG